MAWPTAGNGCPTGPKARVDITLAILSESAADVDGRAIVFHESIDEIETLFLQAADMGLAAVLEQAARQSTRREY